MQHALSSILVALLTLGSIACDSPVAPDPRVPPAVGRPTSVRVEPCEYGPDFARCPLVARWGDLYATEQLATLQAEWSSDSPNVVRMAGPGLLRAVGPGDTVITIDFQGFQLRTKFRVLSVGPPWRVYSGGEYHVEVRDSQDLPLEGVTVEIVAGGNAGMQTMSDRFGRAIFVGDSVCGPITVRATKTGYHDWIGSAIKCGRNGNGAWGSETVGPVRMVPMS